MYLKKTTSAKMEPVETIYIYICILVVLAYIGKALMEN